MYNVIKYYLNSLLVFKVEMKKLNDEIKVKNEQIDLLEKQIADSIVASHDKMGKHEVSQVSCTFLQMFRLFYGFADNIMLCISKCCSILLT